VTGGASGIGQALCEALCDAGAKVVVADIDVVRADKVASDLLARGKQARAVHIDVADADSVQRVVSDAAAEYGRLDFMFNNAAPAWSNNEMRDHPLEVWHQAINVNLLGVVYGSMSAYEIMIRQGFGTIVNTASIAGLVGYPTSIHYSATKAAIINLSYSLRLEAEDTGVNVNVVCPGPIHGKSRYWFKLIGPDGAAKQILKGVARNQTFIVFPLVAKLLWWAYRLSPRLLCPVGRSLVRKNREKRAVQAKLIASSG
jgi:NAD(P)-dependent dehydrogenase (short-subunit alcohol dehydrogenase family)